MRLSLRLTAAGFVTALLAGCSGADAASGEFFRLVDPAEHTTADMVDVTVEVLTTWQPPAVLIGGGADLRLVVNPAEGEPAVIEADAEVATTQLPPGRYHFRFPPTDGRQLCLFNANVVTQCIDAPTS